MELYSGYLYHIYNQGNARQQIFFERQNYFFFLKKVRQEFPPHCYILAWCLMPNHFHFLVRTKDVPFNRPGSWQNRSNRSPDRKERSHRYSDERLYTFSRKIGTLLSSYTQAINKKYEITGSLFRAKTKARCIDEIDGRENELGRSSTGRTDRWLELRPHLFSLYPSKPAAGRVG